MKLLPSHIGSDGWDKGIGEIGRSRSAGSWTTAESVWRHMTEPYMYSLLEVLVGGDGDSYIERDALDGAEAASGRDDARPTLMVVCDGGLAMAEQL